MQKTNRYTRLAAVLIGAYMVLFSIMPVDIIFVAGIIRSMSAGANIESSEAHQSVLADITSQDASGNESEEENDLPPIVEEEDLIAHQPLSPFIVIGETKIVFPSPHHKLCDNIPAISTPPPDGMISNTL